MTIITKGLGEKKSDNLQEPLVENIVVEHADEGKKSDIEAGGYPIPPPQTTRYIISARVRPYYSLMFILLLCLLVATSLLGIFGTEYLFDQYRYLVGQEEQPEVYRTWTSLSYGDDVADSEFENKIVPAHFQKIRDPADSNGILSLLFRSNAINDDSTEMSRSPELKNKLTEKFELDTQKNRYEKIDVPSEKFELDAQKNRNEMIDLPSKGTNRFVHDFFSNYTAIVDLDNQRCFVMPLDRSLVLPPKSLYDLILKMSDGYYSMDTEKIRRDMKKAYRIENREPLGVYINKECDSFDLYMLEKANSTGIVKRSVENAETFTYFDGKNILEFSVQGDLESVPRAIP